MAWKKTNGKIFDLLTTLNKGDSFYVEVGANMATSYAAKHKVNISTKSVIIVEDTSRDVPTIKKIIKITLV